mgnify:CR=1 FL=1
MRLNDTQRALVEANMGLVGSVIAQHVHNINSIGIYSYDDLFQIGCIGLCKAAGSFQQRKTNFAVYACIVIRNEIYHALDYATLRRSREKHTEVEPELPDSRNELWEGNTVLDAIIEARSRMDGIAAKGVDALILSANGFSSAEIGRMHNVSANNITAWIARARAKLRKDQLFLRSISV